MPTAEDQEVVEHLAACGAHPALREGIRAGCPHRQPDNLDALTAEDVVESTGELDVAVTQEEAGTKPAICELPGQVSSLLYHSVGRGVAVQPARWTDAGLQRMAKIIRSADLPQEEPSASETAGVLAIFTGIRYGVETDEERLRRGFVVCDALYTYCKRTHDAGVLYEPAAPLDGNSPTRP